MLLLSLERSRKAALLATAFLFSAGYTAIGLTLMLLVVIAEGVVTRQLPWQRSEGDVYFVGFIALFLVSGWVSPYRPIAVGSAGLAALTIFVAFGPLYRQLRADRGFLQPFLWAWVLGGILAAAWAFTLHRLTGRPAFTPEQNQNALGTALLIPLLLGLGLSLRSQTARGYLLAAGCEVLILGLALTTSRGAWLGAGFGILSFLWLMRSRLSWREGLVLVFVGILLAVILIGFERDSPALAHRASTLFDQYQGRIALAKSARAIFADHILLGTGLNTFSIVHTQYKFPGDIDLVPPSAHNIFLNMAAEGGILGLVTFSVIVVWAGLRGRRWYRASISRAEIILSATVLSTFLGVLVHQLFDSTLLSVHLGSGLWFLVAIMAAFRPGRMPVPGAS